MTKEQRLGMLLDELRYVELQLSELVEKRLDLSMEIDKYGDMKPEQHHGTKTIFDSKRRVVRTLEKHGLDRDTIYKLTGGFV